MRCLNCGAAELVADTRDRPYTHKGETTTLPEVKGDFCPVCGEVVLDKETTAQVSAAMLELLRVPVQVRETIKELAGQRGQSMQEVLTTAVARSWREQLLRQANEAYARIQADPVQKAEYEAELREWDFTLLDGLDEDESWDEGGALPSPEGTP